MLALADVAIVVSNARSSARWWEETMGFRSHTIGSGHALLVAPPGERFVLHLCEGVAPLEPGDTGIAFLSDEIDRDCGRMASKGVTFPEPLHEEKWGKRAKFADPDGNVFWLLGVPTSMVRATLASRAPASTPRRRQRGAVRPGRRRQRGAGRRPS